MDYELEQNCLDKNLIKNIQLDKSIAIDLAKQNAFSKDYEAPPL